MIISSVSRRCVGVESTQRSQYIFVRYVFEVTLERFCRVAQSLRECIAVLLVKGSAVYGFIFRAELRLRQNCQQLVKLFGRHFVINFKFRLGVTIELLHDCLHANVTHVCLLVYSECLCLALGSFELLLQVINLTLQAGHVFANLGVLILQILHGVPEWGALVTKVINKVLLGVLGQFRLGSCRNQVLDDGEDDLRVAEVLTEIVDFTLVFEDLRLLGSFFLGQVLHICFSCFKLKLI